MGDPFRLLVIDDDPGLREYLQALMSRHGYSVSTAESGEEALSGLSATRPDLITLDLVLDGMDGLETLR
ncbi:MAG: response regulator, partial [Myxococcota bacterium]